MGCGRWVSEQREVWKNERRMEGEKEQTFISLSPKIKNKLHHNSVGSTGAPASSSGSFPWTHWEV